MWFIHWSVAEADYRPCIGTVLKFVIERKQLFMGVCRMSHQIHAVGQRFSALGRSIFMAAALFGTTQFAVEGPNVDQLSDCLVKATTATDKTTVLQWTFVALSTHPDLKSFSNVTDTQKNQLDQKFAQVVQRVIVDQCAAQTKAVIQAEGLQAVGDSFQQLGRATGDEILQNPEVKQQLKGVIRYVDLNKLVVTFLTPDVFSKLGLSR